MTDTTYSELDSHADTCVVGKNALVIYDFERAVNVTGFDKRVVTVQAKTVSAVVAYDDPLSGNTILLLLHQAIYIPELESNLLCPMQMRLSGVGVCELPKFLASQPSNSTHAITLQEMGTDEPFVIPLSLQGVTSSFPTRKPSASEYANDSIRRFDLTSDSPEWDPHSSQFAEQEMGFTDSSGLLREPGDERPQKKTKSNFFISGVDVSQKLPSSVNRADDPFHNALRMNVNVSSTSSSSGIKTSTRINKVDANDLSKKWGISIKSAQRTVKATTQRGLRTVLHPAMSRHFRTNDKQLRLRRLRSELFGDTLESSVISRRKNRYAQVFGTSFGWTRAYPVRLKSEVHEGLSLMFRRDGVPPAIIVDGSKEQTQGKFASKVREANC